MNLKSINIGKYTPIIIDCETSGCDPNKHALLESAYVTLKIKDGKIIPDKSETFHVLPFDGALFDPQSMDIHKIDPTHPFRFALSEKQALSELNAVVKPYVKEHLGNRAILIGHNAWFDLAFLNEGFNRCSLKSSLHKFTSCDTATLSGFHLNETVLAKALMRARISYDPQQAHGALYDALKTAELYCYFINSKKK